LLEDVAASPAPTALAEMCIFLKQ